MVLTSSLRTLVFLTIALTSFGCQAIDNPDTPDYLEQFRSSASSYEQAIYDTARTSAEIMEAYREYVGFLEEELATATSAVEAELSGSERGVFDKARNAWDAYLAAEKTFVSTVWTAQNSGSSSAVSRLAFYADVLKSRVELLQKYRLQF